MKGVFCEKLGTPDDLVVREVDDPAPPGEGEVAVALEACGLGFADLLSIAGGYQVQRPLPFAVGARPPDASRRSARASRGSKSGTPSGRTAAASSGS